MRNTIYIPTLIISAAILLFFSCSESSTSFDDSLPDEFSLTILIDPEEGGTVEPEAREFVQGSEVQLEAIAAEGYRFESWEGDIEGDENPVTLRFNDNKQITAKFVVQQEPAIQLESQPVSTTAGERLDPPPRVMLTDEKGLPVPDVNIDVSLNQHDFSNESVTSETTDADGIAIFDQLFIETADTDYVMIFRAESPADTLDFPDRESDVFEVLPADPVLSSDKVDVPQSSRAGEEVVITIFLEDQFGNAVPAEEEKLLVQISGINSTEADIEETDSNGQYEAVYTPTLAGVDQVNIEFDGNDFEGNPYTILIFPGGLSQSNSTVDAEPDELKVGSYSNVTIELKDTFGNYLSGMADDIELANLGNAFADEVFEVDESGIYQTQLSNKAIEIISLSVVVDGIELTEQPEIAFLVGDPAFIEKRSGDEQQANVREELPDPFVIRLTDEFLNPIPDQEIEFEITRTPSSLFSTGASLSTETAITDQQGEAATTLTLGSRQGTYEVQARSPELGQSLTFRAHASGRFN